MSGPARLVPARVRAAVIGARNVQTLRRLAPSAGAGSDDTGGPSSHSGSRDHIARRAAGPRRAGRARSRHEGRVTARRRCAGADRRWRRERWRPHESGVGRRQTGPPLRRGPHPTTARPLRRSMTRTTPRPAQPAPVGPAPPLLRPGPGQVLPARRAPARDRVLRRSRASTATAWCSPCLPARSWPRCSSAEPGTAGRRSGASRTGRRCGPGLPAASQSPEAPVCRFTPSCSEYAVQAVQAHGAARGPCWRCAGSSAADQAAGGAPTPFPDPSDDGSRALGPAYPGRAVAPGTCRRSCWAGCGRRRRPDPGAGCSPGRPGCLADRGGASRVAAAPARQAVSHLETC